MSGQIRDRKPIDHIRAAWRQTEGREGSDDYEAAVGVGVAMVLRNRSTNSNRRLIYLCSQFHHSCPNLFRVFGQGRPRRSDDGSLLIPPS